MIPAEIIEAKRDGRELSPDEVSSFFRAYLDRDVEEYQMAAFLMAVQFQGMPAGELTAMVRVMIDSGRRLNFHDLPSAPVDKHSTGGIGDKVSLVLAPLISAAGLYVPMMSGRGLGHTGGTLDKLDSIPGFRTDLSFEEFDHAVRTNGLVISGQTPEIAPLDGRLYALRNVTGTVPSIPLIAASIMSKKIAAGVTGLVLDVKVGSGAFMTDEDSALELARTMIGIGKGYLAETRALVTSMDRPLGEAVGNALEVREAVECLRGEGPEDLGEITLALAAEMLLVGGVERERDLALDRARHLLDSGAALEAFERMVEAQGGDAGSLAGMGEMSGSDGVPLAPYIGAVTADRAGVVDEVRPRPLGLGVIQLGGGRRKLGDEIDHAVGFQIRVRPGDTLSEGDEIGVVHARTEDVLEVGRTVLRDAVVLGEGASVSPLIRMRIDGEGHVTRLS